MSLEKYLAKKSGKGFKSAAAKGSTKSSSEADKIGGAAAKKADKGGSEDSFRDEEAKAKKKRPYMNEEC